MRIVFVAYDGFQLLDLAGPSDVFRAATRLGAEPSYEIVVATADGRPVRSESGLQLGADGALADVTDLDTLVVVGGHGVDDFIEDEESIEHLSVLASRSRRTTSVCTGALALARAGLLTQRRATTHWGSTEQLALEHPDVEVVPDRIFVRDGDVWTSAGVTAGIDLALALVEDDHGPDLAHAIAGWLVVFAQRPGGQSQFSAQLLARPARSPGIADLQRWLPDHLGEDLTVDTLARRVSMSPRTFARTFRSETGTTPAAYVESLRVEAARRLLETTDLTVTAVAREVGLRHAETLHRAFRRRVGTTPDRYRQHFARRAS